MTSFVGSISPFRPFYPLLIGTLHWWDLRLVAWGKMSGSLEQNLLKLLSILLIALPGPNAQICDGVRKTMLKSPMIASQIAFSRWRRKSENILSAVMLGKWPEKKRAFNKYLLKQSVNWKCFQNFLLRRPIPNWLDFLPNIVSLYLMPCYFFFQKSPNPTFISSQTFGSLILHLLTAFHKSRSFEGKGIWPSS